MSDPLLAVAFCFAAALSLGASWLLVTRLERVGARLGLTEGLLGMLAALAADAPEITAAVTAMLGHRAQTGAGVVIGSNVFNLAALLGLASVLAGRIALHRRVIEMEAVVALWVASICVAVVVGAVPAWLGLLAALALMVPYLIALGALGAPHQRLGRLGLPASWMRWLRQAIHEEEAELEVAIHPRPGDAKDAAVAALAIVVVLGASVAMEQAASTLGDRASIPQIVVGGLLLAGVTSLPNAVAAIYLARRGRGAATLSTAMNSNAINVVFGLLLPGVLIGLGAAKGSSTLVAAWYLGLTAVALTAAYAGRGLSRRSGTLIVGGYLAFAVALLTTAG